VPTPLSPSVVSPSELHPSLRRGSASAASLGQRRRSQERRIVIRLPVPLVGDGMLVPCVDGHERPYVALDTAASTSALEQVLRRVEEFLRRTRASIVAPATSPSWLPRHMRAHVRRTLVRGTRGSRRYSDHLRNTTEAVNHLAYRLRLRPTTLSSPLLSNITPISCRGLA